MEEVAQGTAGETSEGRSRRPARPGVAPPPGAGRGPSPGAPEGARPCPHRGPGHPAAEPWAVSSCCSGPPLCGAVTAAPGPWPHEARPWRCPGPTCSPGSPPLPWAASPLPRLSPGSGPSEGPTSPLLEASPRRLRPGACTQHSDGVPFPPLDALPRLSSVPPRSEGRLRESSCKWTPRRCR